MAGRKWTRTEEREAEELARCGYSLRDTAAELGRPLKGVRDRQARRGRPFGFRRGPAPDADLRAAILDAIGHGCTTAGAVHRMIGGRSKSLFRKLIRELSRAGLVEWGGGRMPCGQRAGFTGTRAGMTARQLVELAAWFEANPLAELHHGSAIGADAEAVGLVQNQRIDTNDETDIPPRPILWWRLIAYPSNDIGQTSAEALAASDVRHKPAPPLERNLSIVAGGLDVLLAAPRTAIEERRSGTWSTIRYAQRIGRPVVLFDPGELELRTASSLTDRIPIGSRYLLTAEEQQTARELSKARHVAARSLGIHNGRIGPQSDELTDLEGIAGELAFCSLFDVPPDLLTGHRPDYDCVLPGGWRVDVKATRYGFGKLLATKAKAGKTAIDLFALMTGTFPGLYTFRGFMTHAELYRSGRETSQGFQANQKELVGLGAVVQQLELRGSNAR